MNKVKYIKVTNFEYQDECIEDSEKAGIST